MSCRRGEGNGTLPPMPTYAYKVAQSSGSFTHLEHPVEPPQHRGVQGGGRVRGGQEEDVVAGLVVLAGGAAGNAVQLDQEL